MRRCVNLHPKLVKSEQAACEHSIKPIKNEILQYLQGLEGCCTTLNAAMIDNQPEINWTMRPYINDFLMDLHLFFKLSQETFFLACLIADKYCCKRIVYKRHYQLLAATSLWIAAKYQDKKTRIPTLKELVLLCHRIYEPKMFVQMERHILTTLEWSVGTLVSTFDVVQWILSASSTRTLPKDANFLPLVSFLSDLTLYQRDYMDYSSSAKAVAVLILASRIQDNSSFLQFINQLLNQLDGSRDDPCFHIAGDNNTNDLSLSLNAETFDQVRACLYLLVKDVFEDKYCDERSLSKMIILKKYKKWPITAWLSNFRSVNADLASQLNSLTNSLKLANNTPYPETMRMWLEDSIINCVDKLMGLQGTEDLLEEDELLLEDDCSRNLSLFSSHSSCFTNDFNIPNCIEGISTPTSSILAPTPSSSNISSRHPSLGSVQHPHVGVEHSHVCPPTPYSANSTFSSRPRLSTGSSTSSVSSRSSASPANLFKKSFRSNNTRYSPINNQLVILRESSNQSELFE
ncbi:uncharacterized protein ZBAI_05128 [Zygosaccharomyces bailii ISA1307]|nr:uncharacterized protein ZBAI_05128 [Zygosaccharomyces bailii ISA1307]